MGRSPRGIAALVGILGVLPLVATSAPAATAQTDAPPDDTTRWVVDRPRFEPIDAPTAAATAAPLTVTGVGDYRGSIELTRNGTKLDVLNHVTVEDYLKGISEVPAAWPLEAQKAQAIAARTYALYEAAKSTDPTAADLCATDSCQVYAGLAKERKPGSQAWLAAVAQTKHQVLLDGTAPIAAKYSSSNGGETVDGGRPYLRRTADPDDARSPLNRWRATYPVADLARAVGLAAEPVNLTRQDEQVVATYLDADGNAIEQRISVEDFRDRINKGFATPANLPLPVPSRRFDVQIEAGQVHIDGRGWGHGIGLSQYGALGKALRGMKAPDILAAYYAGIRPTTMPADRLPEALRIGLATARPDVTVGNAGTGRFRIVDASGRVLAHSAGGTWRATPAPDGRIQLTPPGDQQGLPTATIASLDPAEPTAGKPVNLTVHLDGPGALTTIDLTRPDGTTQVVDPQRLRHPGPLLVRLTSNARPGTYRLHLGRDAGNGRTADTTLTIDVPAAPTGPGATTTDEDEPGDRATVDDTNRLDLAFAGAESLDRAPIPTRALQATATFMLLAVVVLGAFWVGRRPGSQLH